MAQNFPPASELGRTTEINVIFQELGDTKLLDSNYVFGLCQSVALGTGVRLLMADKTCLTYFMCEVQYLPVGRIADSLPLLYAFSITSTLLKPIAGQQSGDLYCIWKDNTFGTTAPVRLSQTLVECVQKQIRELLKDIKKAVNHP